MAPVPSARHRGRPPTPASSTRDRLLAAAYELLLEKGYRAATVQSVASRAGLSNGALYANFATKHDLLLQAVLHRLWRPSDVPRVCPTSSDDDDENDVDLADLVLLLARQLSAPPAPEHRMLTEVCGAALSDDPDESPLKTRVLQLESMARRSIDRAKAARRVDERLSTDALVAVTVGLYLGAITSKSFDRPQPGVTETLELLAVLGLARGPGSDRRSLGRGQPATSACVPSLIEQ